MAAENLTSVFAVWDSVVFLGGVAVGFSGNRGVNFIVSLPARFQQMKQSKNDDSEV